MPATITVSQSPDRYNLVVAPNIWTLDSISSAEDGYILQVQAYQELTSTYTTLATVQQPANPAGVAHFDISKILQSQLDIAFVEETQDAIKTAGETVAYRVRWGSTTDDIITFNGTSNIYYAFNGYLDWREINWLNNTSFIPFPTAVACPSEGPIPPPFETNARYLTRRLDYLHNYPKSSIPLRSSTYHTLSFFNRIGNYDIGSDWGNNEQPWAVRIKFYQSDNTLIQTVIYVLSNGTGLGPRPAYNSVIIPAYETDEWIGTIGAGPQNLKDAGYWPSSSSAIWNLVSQTWGNYAVIWNLASSDALVDHYDVQILSVDMCYWGANGTPANDQAATLEPYLGDLMYTQTFHVDDPCSKFDDVTVSFVNQYGVKDYFTFDRRNTWSQSIRRNNYDQILGSWSDQDFTIDQHGRGRRTFSTEIQTNMTLNSYWMDDAESKWLEELFTSPHIQVYYEGVWHPAVITSNSYQQKTNARDGLFQHTLNIQFANTKRVQRG